MYNTIGPLWDGNEVWLITAGGVTFAAFPRLYAVMFSSLYSALMLILFALIIRGVSLEFRGKVDDPVDDPRWRKIWDTCMCVGSLVPAILFGVAFANIFQGIPIDGAGVYHGTLFTLLNPYGLLGGVFFLLLFLVHGSIWLAVKSEGGLHDRAAGMANKLWPVLLFVAVIFLVASAYATSIYDNYLAHPVLFIFILITVLALVGIKIFLAKKSYWKAWFSSALTIFLATFYGFIGLFPRMFLSNMNPDYTLTAFNSSSSPLTLKILTLKIMLVLALIFIPIVLVYQFWAYNLFKGKVTKDDLAYEEAY